MKHLFLITLTLLATSCGDADSDSMPKDFWSASEQAGAIDLTLGEIARERSYQLTRWFGRETGGDPTTLPKILGDARDGLVTTMPVRFSVKLEASEAQRILSTGLRRLDAPGKRSAFSGHVTCEVFLNRNGALQSLAKKDLAPSVDGPAAWVELQIAIPTGMNGRLEFVARPTEPLGQTSEDMGVAWGNLSLGEQHSTEKPDVLLLTVDTLRVDGLDHMPRVVAILEQGALWKNAVSPSNWTLPAYASLFTNRVAGEHGAGRGPFAEEATNTREERSFQALRGDLPTLAEAFQQAGYVTCMVHQNPLLEPWTGLDRGFDRYVRTRDEVQAGVEVARSWWESKSHRPRFLVLHLMAPHLPYSPPDPDGLLPADPLAGLDWQRFLQEDRSVEERRDFFNLKGADRLDVRQRYFAEAASVDAGVAPWLEELLAGATPPILGFHSDHGEELWDHGSFEHGHSFQDSIIRVPVAVVWKSLPRTGSLPETVSAQDLGPTLLQLAGIEMAAWHPNNLFLLRKIVASARPLYRSEFGGRHVPTRMADEIWMPFNPMSSAGGSEPVDLPPELALALQELGYLATDESDGD